MSALARPRFLYRARGAGAFGLLLVTVIPAWPARAADGVAGPRASATQDGWWNRLQDPLEGEPYLDPARVRRPSPAFPDPGPSVPPAAPAGPAVSDPAVPDPGPAPPVSAAEPAGTASGPAPATGSRPAAGFWDQLPASTALLVPAIAGLAVLVAVVLSPRGRPAPVFRREGGLSRALARREQSTNPTGDGPGRAI